jgi:2-(1,2-epoxy-1,2-dihydrophenyl)acetyl-CoA isomerase
LAYETIIYEKADKVARITLNRPEVLNALNGQMLKELPEAIAEAAKDDNVRAVLITGTGRSFCAGGDHRHIETLTGPAELATGIGSQGGNWMMLALQGMAKPTIAMVNGPAVGGGFDIALACDMRIGSENARFMVAFTRIGLVPGTGSGWLLPRIVGLSKACRLIYTGDLVESEEAYQMGLLDWLVPSDRLEEETMALAHRIAQGPPIALSLDKMVIYEGLNSNFETAIKLGTMCERLCLGTEDFKEGIKAFAEKRQAVFQGK